MSGKEAGPPPPRYRRAARTRAALIDAFNRLVLAGRPRRIRVADIVAAARLGRSTFYDHYSGTEDIHLEALARPFATLADAAAGQGDAARLAHLLRHFWDNRARARETLAGRRGERVERMLVDLVAARLEPEGWRIPQPLAAAQLAAAALAPLSAWLYAAAPCDADALAEAICAAGRAGAAALRTD